MNAFFVVWAVLSGILLFILFWVWVCVFVDEEDKEDEEQWDMELIVEIAAAIILLPVTIILVAMRGSVYMVRYLLRPLNKKGSLKPKKGEHGNEN